MYLHSTRSAVKISNAIRRAAKREGLGIESFRRKHDLPNAWFYGLLRDKEPIPPKVAGPLRKLAAADVRHPLLTLIRAA